MNEQEKRYRGKPKVPIYVYESNGTCKKFTSISEAALAMKEHPTTIRLAAVDGRITKKGYFYSFTQLTANEVAKKFEEREKKISSYKKNQPKERANSNCKEFQDKFEYEVDCFSREVCYLPRTRQGKINLLRNFIYSKLELQWERKPRQLVALEKRFVREILNSLE